MAKLLKSVKVYILLGYFTLILIASVTVWVIYNETLKLYDNQIDMNPVSDKIFLTNSILTDLYEAESLKRSYLQTGNIRHYESYTVLIDSISAQIDFLGSMGGNPWQLMHTDSIQKLLTKKKENLDELKSLKNSASSDKLLERAMLRLTQNKDSLDQLFRIYNTINTSKDSVFTKQRKTRFFERLINVFAPPTASDSLTEITGNETIEVDSIFSTFNPTDSVKQIFTSIIEDIRKETVDYEHQLMQKEQENLENAQTITLQIREILSQFENEEILFSLRKVSTQQEHIHNMTNIVIILGAAALFIIIGFLTLILKDITKSQHYRQNLEKEKAFSESLLKSKEQLMLSITHDLKSPLNSIAGYAHLAANEKSHELQVQYLNKIEQSTGYITRLIKDLLDFARLEAGKMTIENSSVHLKKLMNDVVSDFFPLAKEKNLVLEVEIEKLPDKIYLTDTARLNQILSNLLTNAVKFTNEGKIKVTGKLIKSKGKTDWIQLSVEDTGIGISKENLQLIFEEFSRVSSEKNIQYEGTGLGLAITKRIVDLLNGTIRCKSQPGKGSRFTVELPFQKLNRETISEKNSQPQKNGHKILFNREKVLLVDDDQFLLELITHVLEESNLIVFPFSHPLEASELIYHQPFDLLITDVQMPGKNGFELLLDFHQQNSKDIPAIAITGEAKDQKHYLNAGFSAVVQKPFHPMDLIKTVSGILDNATPENSLTADKKFFTKNNFPDSYSIEGIKAFAEGDMETTREILTSFTNTTAENLQLFKQLLQSEDYVEIRKLAHKMLPMFRQLEAEEIIQPLWKFEQNDYDIDQKHWLKEGYQLMIKIENLMGRIIEDYQLPFSGKLIS